MQEVEESRLVDVEVAGQGRIRARREHAFARLELPEQVEGLSRAAHTTATGVRQSAGLESVNPVSAGFVELQDAGAAGIDDLVQQAKQAYPINRAERGSLGRGRGSSFALGEKVHTAVTGAGRSTLPSEAERYNVLPASSRDRTWSSVTCGHSSKKLPTA